MPAPQFRPVRLDPFEEQPGPVEDEDGDLEQGRAVERTVRGLMIELPSTESWR